VHMEGQVRDFVEVNEQVLASGRSAVEDTVVDQCRVGCEPTLRTRDVDLLAAQRSVESRGQGVDRMALWHVRVLVRSP